MNNKNSMVRVVALAATLVIFLAVFICMLTGCVEYETNGTQQDTANTKQAAAVLQENQPTPTDIDYSLERYNLIRRAYWVNGQREKANALPCEVEKPLDGLLVIFISVVPVRMIRMQRPLSKLYSRLCLLITGRLRKYE